MEFKTIARDLAELLSDAELEKVQIGIFLQAPDTTGCFQRNQEWFACQNDEKAVCTITGPFDAKGVIVAIAKLFHKKGLRFENEQQRMNYINNHFRNFEEIDLYQKIR